MPKRALLGIPSFSGVDPRPLKNFLDCAIVAGRACPDWRFATQVPERASLPSAMTALAQQVRDQDFECLIVFDDDCFPPYDVIPRLLAHMEAGHPFVAGVGVMRHYPHTTTVARVYPEGWTLVAGPDGGQIRGHQWLDDVAALPPLAEVDFCGVPVAAIHRSVFETVPEPWFDLRAEDGGTVTHDVFFCRKLKAAGLPVRVDTTLKCGHLAPAPIITFENRALARELVG